MRTVSHRSGEAGVVLLTTLLILMIVAALMAGFFAAVNTDVRATAIDRDQTQAYAAAHAGLEKLTSDLAQLFARDFSPEKDEILELNTHQPAVPGFEFKEPGGTDGSGYKVSFSRTNSSGDPLPEDINGSNITSGPYKGLKGIITKYPITITARSTTGNSEVRLRRELQTVAVPVFQFGVFSETDLSIYAGENFAFGGRVHTNGSLFLCQQTSMGTMTFNDRITAVNEVIRKYWSNGQDNSSTSPSCTNNVLIPTSTSTNRNLKQSPNEGSVTGMPGSTANTNWTSISTGTYKSYIRTGLTGAKKLDLPLVSQGATPVDLIRRPLINSDENNDKPEIFGQRFFSQASLRILLSDRDTDILQLPTVTNTPPVLLDGTAIGGRPVAKSIGYPTTTASISSTGGSGSSSTGTITISGGVPGWLKMPATPFTIGASTISACTGIGLSSGIPQIEGCTVAGATTPANTAFTVTLPSGEVASLMTYSSGTATTGTNKNIKIVSTRDLTIGSRLIWAVPSTSTSKPVMLSCQGYNATQLINCYWPSGVTPSGVLSTNARSDANQSLIGGYIKIEMQDDDEDWTDVTAEILGLGFADKNQAGSICSDPTPDAVIRFQRLRDNGTSSCGYGFPSDFWPQTLYDPREGSVRDVASNGPLTMAGVIQYISLDVANLKKWLAGTTGASGDDARNNNGYIVYFSDRRGNHNSADSDNETGEFGFEDQVNSTSSGGAADSTLQAGEDMNGNGTQQLYGRIPSTVGNNIPTGAQVPYDSSTSSTPTAQITLANSGQARVNKVVLFRRALKIVNGGIVGGISSLPDSGLTIVSENPVYVQGNYNATTDVNVDPHRPAAIIGDAITLLSNAWSDANMWENPNDVDGRLADTTGWRFAALAGKGVVFPYCGSACGSPGDLFGTDGGAGNFLRLLEKWYTNSQVLSYKGSLISLHNSRQGIGTYKFPNNHIYTGGTRNFSFDIDFLNPTLLPPGTPMFRDVNTLTFRQILRPTQ
jgi:hypothetical protein